MTEDRPRAPREPRGPRAWTVRLRVLTAMMALMTVGLAVTGVLTYAAQFRALDARVEAELWQEYDELALIAQSADEAGEPVHETVDSVLVTATDSAAPSDFESVLTFLDGQPRYEPRQQDFALLEQPAEGADAEEAARLAAEAERVQQALLEVHEPGRAVIVPLEAYDRDLRVLVASVTVEGDEAQGVFVVANDVGAQRRDLWRSVLTFTGLSVLTLLLAGGVGYVITGRLLRPLEDLREATEQITVEDLEHRVPVPDGRDDIGALARNFNRMLERIQAGFAEQRRFMSDVGHELRTPLTIVRGTLETTDRGDPADVREAHDIALEELERMGRVVGDLSELAASTRPDFVRPRPLDMAAFARSAFARITHVAERDWVLARTVDAVAEADEQRLAQAVVQLAANAARYSDEGSHIRLAVDRVLGADGPEIHVSVQDEGIGIAPEDQHRIFERFARLDESRGTGSGLGLPIVRAIAEGHGGTVRLDSAPGRGSTFTIVIPQAPAAPSAPEGVHGGAGAGGSSGGRTARDNGPRRADPGADHHTTTRGREHG
ncbi:sensor histidine kinase [Brachybacterium saurashtrense]|uniref:histidine kinase n=1 Tax=Brachybacterium saurashtrense TaxID=556288 RepID=A0A345YSJ2_9MICO|nr:HAMP domain-containing sensor histidine kinase [Brachybacterium saurashtrense]AXK46894.1 sensor histidine kinase [Brachybacterium saurashtrense]RRR22609.1 sensor histidine kinase [Brachybacterium saurashtrense]